MSRLFSTEIIFLVGLFTSQTSLHFPSVPFRLSLKSKILIQLRGIPSSVIIRYRSCNNSFSVKTSWEERSREIESLSSRPFSSDNEDKISRLSH